MGEIVQKEKNIYIYQVWYKKNYAFYCHGLTLESLKVSLTHAFIHPIMGLLGQQLVLPYHGLISETTSSLNQLGRDRLGQSFLLPMSFHILSL